MSRRVIALAFALIAWVIMPARAWAGYSHYWVWHRSPEPARVAAAVAEMNKIAEQSRDVAVVLAAAETKIELNGIGEHAHETFVFPHGWSHRDGHGFNFVKTAYLPYDQVVTACLLVARHHFTKEELTISSDGTFEMWQPGRALFHKTLGRVPPELQLQSAEGGVPVDDGFAPPVVRKPSRAFDPVGLVYLLAIVVLFYLLFVKSTSGGVSWTTYYLFWILAPTVASMVVEHWAVFVVIPIALLARRWLPDPFLYLRHRVHIRALEMQAAMNPANVTARRDVAKLWLQLHRPARALRFVDEALAKEPSSSTLRHLRGICLIGTGEHDKAVDQLVALVGDDPSFAQGEPYLRAGEALMALARWDDAEDAFERFVDLQSSSVEGWYRLAQVRAKKDDRPGAREALKAARDAYEGAPSFHRRKNIGWYWRARLTW
jgi:hypothetical protein